MELSAQQNDPPQWEERDWREDPELAVLLNEELPRLQFERDYEHFFLLDVGGTLGNDEFVLKHANGLVVVGLAPMHAALRGGRGEDVAEGNEGRQDTIAAVDFAVGKRNRQLQEPSGKSKKNAALLCPDSALCKVLMQSGATFVIRSCVKGLLIEVNKQVVESPHLLQTMASSQGFIAILMPKAEDWNSAKSTFLSKEEYMKKRGTVCGLGDI